MRCPGERVENEGEKTKDDMLVGTPTFRAGWEERVGEVLAQDDKRAACQDEKR